MVRVITQGGSGWEQKYSRRAADLLWTGMRGLIKVDYVRVGD
jgi:hypothetical protein